MGAWNYGRFYALPAIFTCIACGWGGEVVWLYVAIIVVLSIFFSDCLFPVWWVIHEHISYSLKISLVVSSPLVVESFASDGFSVWWVFHEHISSFKEQPCCVLTGRESLCLDKVYFCINHVGVDTRGRGCPPYCDNSCVCVLLDGFWSFFVFFLI